MENRINNVFVLCTGRCGSLTFAKACSHATNYSVGHESLARKPGRFRLHYPKRHVEVDNRLCWFLGRLDSRYGDSAFYVHLRRREEDVANSLNQRWHLRDSIMRAYADQLHMARVKDPLALCFDYIETVTMNINLFLKDKTNVISISLERVDADFPEFWTGIHAEGDLSEALREFSICHNATPAEFYVEGDGFERK